MGNARMYKTKKIKENLIDDDMFEIIDKCLIIKLDKELDHHCALKIRERSDKIIEEKNIKNIIFDFKDSDFMDSSGIGVIMGRYKRVIFIGGKISVVNVNKAVDRIFVISGLYKIVGKYQSIEDAIKGI